MVMFTALIFVVTTKFISITRLFIWPITASFVLGTYCTYIAYIWSTDNLKDLVKHHYTFYKIAGSLQFHFAWMMPAGFCLYFDYFIEAVSMLIFKNP